MIIALCGFMGAGKTTLARKVARVYPCKAIDLDEYIVKITGKSIPDIFADSGEDGFRKIETQALTEISETDGDVILSLGGGALEREENAEILKAKANIVFLDVPFSVCFNRIKNSARPLVKSSSREELEEKFNKRRKRYLEVSDIALREPRSKALVDAVIEIFGNNR